MSGCSRNKELLSEFGGQNKNIGDTYLSQSFQEQHLIRDFIRISKLITIIETVCEDFVNNLSASNGRPEDGLNAIIIKLPLIYSDFHDNFSNLLRFIIDEPVEFTKSFKYSVFGIVRDTFKELTRTAETKSVACDINIDQVHIFIRFLGLPLRPDLCFQPHTNCYPTGLSEIVGILAAVTEPTKVVIHSVWFCSTGCGRNKISTISLDVPACPSCRRPMNEYSKLRYTQNVRLLQILPAESLECPTKLSQTFRALTVRVEDHVIDFNLKLGYRYFITGYYNYFSETE